MKKFFNFRKFFRRYKWHIVFALIVFQFFFPQYLKRAVYPYLYGKKTNEVLEISAHDFFEDVSAPAFVFTRGKYAYILEPKTRYAVTGRVGILDHYDTLWNRFFRGQFQGKYINLVPRDIFLVIGQMAQKEVFKKFKFEHEERLGRVLCKGVKYRTSFMSAYKNQEEAEKSQANFRECHQYIKQEEQNNYHPIPATERINKALSMLLPGDLVHLEGILVDVPQMRLNTGTRKEQYHENMIVNGMAPGMCFILYTTKVMFNGRIYE